MSPKSKAAADESAGSSRPPLRLGVLVSGRGSNFKAIQDAIDAGTLNATITALFSNKPDAPALALARHYGIPHYSVSPAIFSSRDEYESHILDCINPNQIDYLILAGYLKLVGPVLLNAFPNRIINIHPSLLPAFKGLNAQQQAVDYGVKLSGATVHFVNEDLDAGPIILQESIPVAPDDTGETLSAKILKIEHQLFPKALQLLAQGAVTMTQNKTIISSPKSSSINSKQSKNPIRKGVSQ